MGSLLGGGAKQTANVASSQSTAPDPEQQMFVNGQWQGASNALANSVAVGPYTGSLYTGENSDQAAAASQAGAYTTGLGAQLAASAGGTANTLYGGANAYENNASNLATNGIAPANSTDTGVLQNYATGATAASGPSAGLSSALNSAATQGATAVGNTTAAISAKGLADNTGQTIADANAYTNSAATTDAINASNSQIAQTLNETTVPGLNREAAQGGGLNSSRAGMAEAQANEGAGIAEGLADASITNNAYNTGIQASTSQQESGLQAANTAAGADSANSLGVAGLQQGLSENNAANQLGAANSALSSQLGFEGTDANTQLAANAQLGTGISLANSSNAASGDAAANNYNIGEAAGSVAQTNANNQNAANYSQWQATQAYPWTNLDNYAALADSPSTSAQTGVNANGSQATAGSSGILGGVLGLAGTAAGAYFSGGNPAGAALGGAAGSAVGQALDPSTPGTAGTTGLNAPATQSAFGSLGSAIGNYFNTGSGWGGSALAPTGSSGWQ